LNNEQTSGFCQLLQQTRQELLHAKRSRFSSTQCKHEYWQKQEHYLSLKSIWNICFIAQLPTDALQHFVKQKEYCYFEVWYDDIMHLEVGWYEHDIQFIFEEDDIVVWCNDQILCQIPNHCSKLEIEFEDCADKQIQQIAVSDEFVNTQWTELLESGFDQLVICKLIQNIRSNKAALEQYRLHFCDFEALLLID
jgi:hypothetical protein